MGCLICGRDNDHEPRCPVPSTSLRTSLAFSWLGRETAGCPIPVLLLGQLEISTTTTKDLLKPCQKVLDILTKGEHYGSTLGEKFRYSAPLRTTPRDSFRGVGHQAFNCVGI
jgi:hypothetical protein